MWTARIGNFQSLVFQSCLTSTLALAALTQGSSYGKIQGKGFSSGNGNSSAVFIGLLKAEPWMISLILARGQAVLWNAELKAVHFLSKEGPDLLPSSQ